MSKVASSRSEETAAGGKQLLPCELIYGSDGKRLKPLQLTYPQFMLANIKILETLTSSSPNEAQQYVTYLKFLAVKGTRFQTRAILAFDQDYRSTKLRVTFSWISNEQDLSAHYFDAAVALKLPTGTTRVTERRSSGNDEFCFRWNFSPGGGLNPQSCRYKHVSIHCSQSSQKGKACTGDPTGANPTSTPPEEYPLNFHAWQKELAFDLDKDFILDGLYNGFKLIKEPDVSGIAGYDAVNYASATWAEFKPDLEELFAKELCLGRISNVLVKPKCIHAIGRVPKKYSGKSRPITNCSRPREFP